MASRSTDASSTGFGKAIFSLMATILSANAPAVNHGGLGGVPRGAGGAGGYAKYAKYAKYSKSAKYGKYAKYAKYAKYSKSAAILRTCARPVPPP